jgi:hypothetical protein
MGQPEPGPGPVFTMASKAKFVGPWADTKSAHGYGFGAH